jgi:hypothetical protein
VCLRVMRFFLWKCGAIFAGASLIVICSCEKHRVGELPEVQKEHVDLAKESEQVELVPTEKSEGRTPEHTPTPAEFFPEKTPH